MKSLIALIIISLFSIITNASHFQMTMDRGYFKNSFSLADAKTKNETTYILSHLSNGQVRKFTVLTKQTFEHMKRDFIQIAQTIKDANRGNVGSCDNPVTLKAQGKQQSLCASHLTASENKRLEAWLDKARFYSGLEKLRL